MGKIHDIKQFSELVRYHRSEGFESSYATCPLEHVESKEFSPFFGAVDTISSDCSPSHSIVKALLGYSKASTYSCGGASCH
jgi:hypothetical protein